MAVRWQRGFSASLWAAADLRFSAPFSLALGFAALLLGRPWREVGLVVVTVLVGQVLLGWLGELSSSRRRRAAGVDEGPVAAGWIAPGDLGFAATVAVLLLVPLSISNGTVAGLSYLGSVAALATAYAGLGATALSWLPWAVGYGLLPAFLAYGGWGGGLHGDPPTITVSVLAALLGIGVHFARSLPRLVEDDQSGYRHLPLRWALSVGAPGLLWVTTTYIAVLLAALVIAIPTVGFTRG